VGGQVTQEVLAFLETVFVIFGQHVAAAAHLGMHLGPPISSSVTSTNWTDLMRVGRRCTCGWSLHHNEKIRQDGE